MANPSLPHNQVNAKKSKKSGEKKPAKPVSEAGKKDGRNG
jgi:hypothetical protein